MHQQQNLNGVLEKKCERHLQVIKDRKAGMRIKWLNPAISQSETEKQWHQQCDAVGKLIEAEAEFEIEKDNIKLNAALAKLIQWKEKTLEDRVNEQKEKDRSLLELALQKIEKIKEPLAELEAALKEIEAEINKGEAELDFLLETKYDNQPPKPRFYDN